MQTITYNKIFYSSYMVYQTLKHPKVGGRWFAFNNAVRHFFDLLFLKLKGIA